MTSTEGLTATCAAALGLPNLISRLSYMQVTNLTLESPAKLLANLWIVQLVTL